MPDPVSPVLEAAARYRAQLAAKDAQALSRLIDAYRRSYRRMVTGLDALLLSIGDDAPTRGQLVRMERYRALIGQVAEELRDLQALTKREVEQAAELGIRLGEQHGRELISITATGGTEIAARFHVLPKGTIEQLLGFLEPDGALYRRLSMLAPSAADAVSEALVGGVTIGKNPAVIARSVQSAFGQGLTDALRFVRTVQLWSYREANRASYVANSDVVMGWVWHAELGPRTCASCFANHGRVYPLSQPLNDHHNGRCAAVPLVKGFENPVTQSGEEWFKAQPEAFQRQVLGTGKFDAWQAGRFEFSALSTTHTDAVYGPMRVETPLRELVGEP
jgi:hypothetical protein